MAVIFDATATGSATGATSITWSHTNTTEGSRIIVAWCAFIRAAGGTFSATYAGQAMTLIANDLHVGGGTGDHRYSSAYLLNPPTGANNVQFIYTQTCDWAVASMSFYNVKSYGGVARAQSTSTQNLSVARACAVEDLVVGMLAYADGDIWDPTAFTPNADDIERRDTHYFTGAANHMGVYGGTEQAVSTSRTVGASWSGLQGATVEGINLVPVLKADQSIWWL